MHTLIDNQLKLEFSSPRVAAVQVQKQIDEEENEEECCLAQVQPESGEMGTYLLRDDINIPSSEAEATKLQGPIFKVGIVVLRRFFTLPSHTTTIQIIRLLCVDIKYMTGF